MNIAKQTYLIVARFEVLGPEGEQPQGDQGVNDFEIINAPGQTLPSVSEDPDPLEGQDYVPAHTVAHNTVPGTDTRKLRRGGECELSEILE